MLIIQVVAAMLLLLGSALVFKALIELDASNHARSTARPRPLPEEPDAEVRLPRAA